MVVPVKVRGLGRVHKDFPGVRDTSERKGTPIEAADGGLALVHRVAQKELEGRLEHGVQGVAGPTRVSVQAIRLTSPAAKAKGPWPCALVCSCGIDPATFRARGVKANTLATLLRRHSAPFPHPACSFRVSLGGGNFRGKVEFSRGNISGNRWESTPVHKIEIAAARTAPASFEGRQRRASSAASIRRVKAGHRDGHGVRLRVLREDGRAQGGGGRGVARSRKSQKVR